jgi:uncharacterized protein (DUF2336 family)
MSGLLEKLIGARGGAIDYEKAKRLAAADSRAKRLRLAARDDVQPEILYFLAEDPDAEVRRTVAANDAAPVHAGLLLVGDPDGDVRCSLARRIARLAPGIDAEDRDSIRAMVDDLLQRLAEDQLPRVRRIVAEELKACANVPAAVIRRLAEDPDLAVAGPVLEFSPLLDDATLLALIRNAPADGALAAIARRAGLSGPVSDAIAGADDIGAIAALLGNRSAQIREETLDALVERAIDIEDWHAPLVRRPALSQQAMRALSRFVAGALLDELAARDDIDAETAAVLAEAVNRRLDAEDAGISAAGREAPGEDPAARAERLFAAGALDEATVAGALGKGERGFVTRALALLSGLSEESVQQAVSLASAKGVTAIAWKAGLGMRTAVQLQLRLARIPPPRVLQARAGTDYPLTEEEMRWQIEFIGG